MLKLIVLSVAMIAVTSAFSVQSANAFPTPEMIKENFQTCVDADPTWMARWGKWVIGYELGAASDLCRAKSWPSLKVNTKQTGCYIGGDWFSGDWIVAGFYCEPF